MTNKEIAKKIVELLNQKEAYGELDLIELIEEVLDENVSVYRNIRC